MKKISVCALGLLGVLLIAAPGSAANPPAGAPSVAQPIAPVNGLAVMNPFKLVSVTRGQDGANGMFQIDVAVENVSATPKKLNLEAHAHGGAVNTLLTNVDVAPKATRHVVFSDPGGPPPACGFGAREYDVSVGETGGSPVLHHAVMHAGNCSFTSEVKNPWNLMTPDHVEAMTSNSVYVQPVTVETQPTCLGSMKLKAVIINHSGKAQSGVRVALKEGATTDGISAPISIAKGGFAEVSFTAGSPIHALGVVSLEGGSGTVENAGITVKVTQNCTYTSDIDPKDSPPVVLH